MPANKYCPFCGNQSLHYIEDCEADADVKKTSWSCECHDFVLYIYDFSKETTGK